MSGEGKASGFVSIIGPPLLVTAATILVHMLPTSVQLFLLGWTLLSIPVGVLIGHCALSEE